MLDHQDGHKIQVTYKITAYWALSGGAIRKGGAFRNGGHPPRGVQPFLIVPMIKASGALSAMFSPTTKWCSITVANEGARNLECM